MENKNNGRNPFKSLEDEHIRMFEDDGLERVAKNIEKRHDSARFRGDVTEHFVARAFKTLVDFVGGSNVPENKKDDDDRPKAPNER